MKKHLRTKSVHAERKVEVSKVSRGTLRYFLLYPFKAYKQIAKAFKHIAGSFAPNRHRGTLKY